MSSCALPGPEITIGTKPDEQELVLGWLSGCTAAILVFPSASGNSNSAFGSNYGEAIDVQDHGRDALLRSGDEQAHA